MGNNLRGTLPWELALLTNMETIQVRLNELSGTIPTQYRRLSRLRTFEVAENYMTGTIPCWMYGFKEPQDVDDDEVTTSNDDGCSDAKTLPFLRTLDLVTNYFTGTLQADVQLYPGLNFMYLSGNALSGSIPDELFDIGIDNDTIDDSLIELTMMYNMLSGSIPTTIGNLRHLELFWIDENFLIDGTIPTQLGTLIEMKDLSISYCRLSGEFRFLSSCVRAPNDSSFFNVIT